MAMPPGGQSSWHHTSDSFHLLDEGDVVWGLVGPDALAVIDARGRARLLVCRGSEADPAWPPGGERGSLAGGAASFCMPVGPGMRVSAHAVSLP
jgi:hypothetical protein